MRKLKVLFLALLIGFGGVALPVRSDAFIMGNIWWTEIPMTVPLVYALRTLIAIDILGIGGTWLAREPISGLFFFISFFVVLDHRGQTLIPRFEAVSVAQAKTWKLSENRRKLWNENLPRMNLALDVLTHRLKIDPVIQDKSASDHLKMSEANRVFQQVAREIDLSPQVLSNMRIVGARALRQANSR